MYPLKAVLIGCSEPIMFEVEKVLSKEPAEIEFEFPDVKTAVANLPINANDKWLFIVQIDDAQKLAHLERLSDSFLGQPIVAMISETSESVSLFQKAMRAGAAQVVRLPVQMEDFKLALDRIAKQYGYASGRSKVIAVASVKEGCGATALAINIAHEAARMGASTILTELTSHIGRLVGYLGKRPQVTTADLLSTPEELDANLVRQALTPYAPNLHVLPGPFHAIADYEPTPSDAVRLIEHLRRLARVIVVDLPSYFNATFFMSLTQADSVLLVAQQNVPAVQSLLVLRDSLDHKENVGKQFVVLNRYEHLKRELTADDLRTHLHVPRVFTVANDYKGFAEAARLAESLRDVAPRSPALRDISDLTAALLGFNCPLSTHEERPNLTHLLTRAKRIFGKMVPD